MRFSDDEIIAIKTLSPARGGPKSNPVPGTAQGQGTSATRGGQGNVHIILGQAGRSVAIPVDDLVGQQLVLLRPLRGLMSKVRNVTGVALLSGGEVGMVLSPGSLCGTADTSESLEMTA